MVSYPKLLRAQYGKNGLYAGSSHFRDYWVRDELFACLGVLALKTKEDRAQVERTLAHLAAHIRADGLVPIRIGGKNQVARFLGLPTRDGPVYTQDKGRNPAVDPNLLFLIVAAELACRGGRAPERAVIERVTQWVVRHAPHDVIEQGPYADWEDSIKHHGPRLYTTVCLYAAWRAAATLLQESRYHTHAERTRRTIQSWWSGSYFTDGPRNRALLVAGNLLAVVWGVASEEQAKRILTRVAQRDTICPPAGFWKPGPRDAHLPFFAIHLADYHGMMEWSWLAAIEIVAYRTVGAVGEARKRAAAFDKLVTRHKDVYEVYEKDTPVKRLVYRSERHFTWAIGLRVLANAPILRRPSLSSSRR